jgi:hypothetical protein
MSSDLNDRRKKTNIIHYIRYNDVKYLTGKNFMLKKPERETQRSKHMSGYDCVE